MSNIEYVISGPPECLTFWWGLGTHCIFPLVYFNFFGRKSTRESDGSKNVSRILVEISLIRAASFAYFRFTKLAERWTSFMDRIKYFKA